MNKEEHKKLVAGFYIHNTPYSISRLLGYKGFVISVVEENNFPIMEALIVNEAYENE